MAGLWHKRSVGIKIWGFDEDPHALANSIDALTDSTAKGDPHGTKNTYRENQIHILKVLDEDSCWGDELVSLTEQLGGCANLKSLLNSIQPKSYFVVINIPESDAFSGAGNHISNECISILSDLKCNVSFNFF